MGHGLRCTRCTSTALSKPGTDKGAGRQRESAWNAQGRARFERRGSAPSCSFCELKQETSARAHSTRVSGKQEWWWADYTTVRWPRQKCLRDGVHHHLCGSIGKRVGEKGNGTSMRVQGGEGARSLVGWLAQIGPSSHCVLRSPVSSLPWPVDHIRSGVRQPG